MFRFLFLLATANGVCALQSFSDLYPNDTFAGPTTSTSTAITTQDEVPWGFQIVPTSSASGIQPPPCDPYLQECDRVGAPFLNGNPSQVENPFLAYNDDNKTLISICAAAFESSRVNWEATAAVYGEVLPLEVATRTITVYPPITDPEAPGHDRTSYITISGHITTTKYPVVTKTTTILAHSSEQYASQFHFATPSSCCFKCILYGGDIQVYYWPTATPSGSASTLVELVDANGFTL